MMADGRHCEKMKNRYTSATHFDDPNKWNNNVPLEDLVILLLSIESNPQNLFGA